MYTDYYHFFFFDQPDIVSADRGILSIWLILSDKEKDV